VTFPVATWLAFAVVTYIWQFTTLTDLAARNAAARDLQLATLLLVGLLFWLPAVAADPVRWRLAYPVRALYVFVEMTHKALFGGMFLSMNHAFHRDFAARAPDWAPSPMMDQRAAILILWIGGNLIFLLALILIVAGWIAYDARAARRADWRLALERAARERRRQALDQVFRRPV
jgi:cytochrome c oxidase assembly factor CtaG